MDEKNIVTYNHAVPRKQMYTQGKQWFLIFLTMRYTSSPTTFLRLTNLSYMKHKHVITY